MRMRLLIACAAGLATTLMAVGPAQGSVILGSNLTSPANESGPCTLVSCTVTGTNLVAGLVAPGGLTSPVNGTVTRWSFKSNSAGQTIAMRVLRPGSGTTYTGAGTSASVASVTGLNGPFATSLPIQAADHVGLDATSGAIILGDVGAPNMALSWSPTPLADGESRSGSIVFNREVLVQASVDPTNTVTFGAINRNKKKGTARVTVTIPNAGALTYAGSRAKVAGPASVAGPADIQLTVRAKGRSKRKLNETGKVKVAVDVIFTPTNGTAGTSPNKVKLLKRLNT